MTGWIDPPEGPAPTMPWTTMLILSVGLHLVGLVGALALPHLMPRARTGPPVYVVDLVALPAGALAAAPASPVGAPPPKAEPPRARPEKAIAIPDRTPKKPQAKKTPEPKKTPESAKSEKTKIPLKPEQKPAAPEAQPQPEASAGETRQAQTAPGAIAVTGAQAGGAGGTGAGTSDAFTFYISLLHRNIENAWKKPIYPPTETSRKIFTATIRFSLTSSGRVSNLELVTSSGYDAMDRSILAAVHEAIFPALPPALGQSLTVPIEFVLTPD